MSFLSSFKKLLGLGGEVKKRGIENRNVITDKDPNVVWEIVGELGDGAFGKVYKAERRDTKTMAALKQVEIKADDDLEDFLVEIDILDKCRHKNVVGLHETYLYGGKLWMYIEFCGGGAVDSIMVDLEKPLNEEQIRFICHEMCVGLTFIHQKKVIHRDLKAGNVLLTVDGDVKLADFGVSAINDRSVQKRDSFIGTPYWMAPEVILCETLKDTPYNYKADIWSLGITLIEFAQIEPPNHEMHPMRVLIKIQKAEPPSLDNKHKWSADFRDFLKQCLSKDPDLRPTAQELLRHPFLSSKPVDKKPVLDLISESKADVIETVEDLTEEEDIQEMKRHMTDDSNTELDKISQGSNESAKKEKTPEKVEVPKDDKANVPEKVPEKATPPEAKTPDDESPRDKSTKKAPAPIPPTEKTVTPPPKKEVTPPPEPEKKESPREEKEDKPDVKIEKIEEPVKEKEEDVSIPVPNKDETTPPSEPILPNKEEATPTKEGTLPHKDETQLTKEEVTPSVEETTPTNEGVEEQVDIGTIAPPAQFLEEDKLSDEGIGPSADEKSDTSSQNESPAKVTDVQIDITPIASEIVEEIIDEVVKSTSTIPSVPSVVLDTIDTLLMEEEGSEEAQGEPTAAGASDSAIEPRESIIDEKGDRKEQIPARQSSVSELVNNLEKMREEKEDESVEVNRASPRRLSSGSMSPADGMKEGSLSPRDRKKMPETIQEDNVVSVTNVAQKDDVARTTSGEKRELEVQSVKVKISDDDESPIASSNIDDIITINGQPVPAASTIVLNGHISKIKDTPGNEVEWRRQRSESPHSVSSRDSRGSSKAKDMVPQTDLDTFETKIANGNGGPLDISNPDDDSSDQRSDTGSINTVDSVDKEESKQSPGPRKAHIRQKNDKSNKSQYRTLTKTRTYMKDGEVVTSRTQRVVLAGEEHKSREEHISRKQDLRELKMLQKNENKQYQDLIYKAQIARELQDKKFETDMQALVKNYDQDMETLTKQQKQQVEKAESTQAVDLKSAAKRIKSEQEKDLKLFKDKQKQDRKLMQQEFDMLAKTAKKEDVRKRKEQKEIQLHDEEHQFLVGQQERMDKHMRQLTETHRQKIAMLESQFLQQKQQLLRAREAAIWELEKQQLHEKHQLAKSQLKDMFFLKRHQMLNRHQKEIEQMKRSNQSKEEEMQHRHVIEKKRLPKILKQESKTRSLMFKQSLRLSIVGNPEDERSKLKQFEENEKKRIKAEQARQENKHKKQWEELVFRNETSLRELEQLQAEKRKMLTEHETSKIKELEEHYSNELREWKAMLIPRKQRLEDEFAKQREEQEKFYGAAVMTGDSSYGGQRSVTNSLRGHKGDSISSRHSTVI